MASAVCVLIPQLITAYLDTDYKEKTPADTLLAMNTASVKVV